MPDHPSPEQSSPRDLKLAAATRRLDAVEQAALRLPEPGRSLVLSILADLHTAMAGEASWTSASVDEVVTVLARGWSN